MSFLDHYFNDHVLDELDDTVKKRMEEFKKVVEEVTDSEQSPMGQLIANYSTEIIDLVERVTQHLEKLDFSVAGVMGTFKFAYQIGVEISQLVEDIAEDIFSGDMSDEEVRMAKVELVQDIVYLIWKTFDPVSKAPWGWVKLIPFRSRIERFVVRWLAGMAMDFVLDLLEANPGAAEATLAAKVVGAKFIGGEGVVFMKTLK